MPWPGLNQSQSRLPMHLYGAAAPPTSQGRRDGGTCVPWPGLNLSSLPTHLYGRAVPPTSGGGRDGGKLAGQVCTHPVVQADDDRGSKGARGCGIITRQSTVVG
jgi:hypothetical protein